MATVESLDGAEQIVLRSRKDAEVSLVQYRRDRPGFTDCTPNAPSESYLVAVNLRPLGAHCVWRARKCIPRQNLRHGALSLFDLRDAWHAELDQPFYTVNFSIAQGAFDELVSERRDQRAGRLWFKSFCQGRDEVMLHLALALLPALKNPREVNRIFADHVAWAVTAHLAETYGGVRPDNGLCMGGLSPARERIAKDMMLANLAGEMSIRDLAEACGFSQAHFSRAFRQATGKPPHRWLLEQRVERAKKLLAHTDDDISAIALACGFADQSHLTRVFFRATGITPGAWRRARIG